MIDQKRFSLRMDRRLFETISLIAKKHKRSVGKEIEVAIERYVTQSRKEDSGGDRHTSFGRHIYQIRKELI